MSESQQLLAEFVKTGSEDAYRELIGRYIDLVYSTAFRMVGGDNHLAEDITQTVFVRLARNAAKLPAQVMLGGWLHRDTCNVAGNFLRKERRRQARERQVAIMESIPDHSKANLAQVTPVLDEAIESLNEEDRAAVLLRFFEQLDFRGVGEILGSSEDAARMRVSRALEKLHGLLTRRGVALSTTALAAGLTSEAVSAAPAGLAATVATTALAGSAAAIGMAAGTIKTITMTKIHAVILGSLVIGVVATPMWIQHKARVRVQEENRSLLAQLQQLAAENLQLSNQLAQTAEVQGANNPAQLRELLKLRGEVNGLKRELAETQLKARNESIRRNAEQQQAQMAEQWKEFAIAKLNYTKGWMLAFWNYAQQHGGQLPQDFESAASFAPETVTGQTNLAPDQFEIVYHGLLTGLTNAHSLIVIREKEPWQGTDGGWARGYGFADGHSEIHKAVDGNFEPWEAQHMITLPEQPGQ